MSLTTARAEVFKILSAALGTTAKVHNRQRYAAELVERDKLFKTAAGELHTWWVTTADDNPFLTVDSKGQEGRNPSNYEMGRYTFTLLGFMAMNDGKESELTFEATVEAVIAAFRANKRLNDTVIDSGPLQYRQGGYITFPPGDGGTLCHQARLDLSVLEQREP